MDREKPGRREHPLKTALVSLYGFAALRYGSGRQWVVRMAVLNALCIGMAVGPRIGDSHLTEGMLSSGMPSIRIVRWLDPIIRNEPFQTGVASWYGEEFHGRTAASGEVYDMEQLTAAHRTLPFGTRIRVRRLDDGRSVVVRINDRGPFVDSRVIDVSTAAARHLGIAGSGTARVALEMLDAPADVERGLFAVQVGAFRDLRNAQRAVAEMEHRFGKSRMVPRQGEVPLWAVLAGEATTLADAESLAGAIRQDKNLRGAFVIRL